MNPNGGGWHYIVVKNSSALLTGTRYDQQIIVIFIV